MVITEQSPIVTAYKIQRFTLLGRMFREDNKLDVDYIRTICADALDSIARLVVHFLELT